MTIFDKNQKFQISIKWSWPLGDISIELRTKHVSQKNQIL